MLRTVDFLLLLPPLVLGLVWLRTGAAPSPRLLQISVAITILLAAALVWFGLRQALPPGTYIPAQLHNGAITPGHSAAP